MSFFVTQGRSFGCRGHEELNGYNVLSDLLVALTLKPFVSELHYFLLMFSGFATGSKKLFYNSAWKAGTILAKFYVILSM